MSKNKIASKAHPRSQNLRADCEAQIVEVQSDAGSLARDLRHAHDRHVAEPRECFWTCPITWSPAIWPIVAATAHASSSPIDALTPAFDGSGATMIDVDAGIEDCPIFIVRSTTKSPNLFRSTSGRISACTTSVQTKFGPTSLICRGNQLAENLTLFPDHRRRRDLFNLEYGGAIEIM